jgi:5'-nucleotidase (lipoprotein e(P4) family)
MKPHRLALVAAVLAWTAACASAPTPPPQTAPPPTPAASTAVAPVPPVPATVAPDDLLNATLWTQRAVEHDLVYLEVYRDAREKLAAALADPGWDALPKDDREASPQGLPPAVILDIDEAILDNSPYEARLIRSGEEYSEFTWAQWCKEEAARPLPGAMEFTRWAADHGIAVYYISNRAQDLDAVTVANLRKAGFPVAGAGSFLGLGTLLPGCEQIGSDKGCRRRLVGRDHRVLMQFGDNLGDFLDVVANTNDGRAQAMAPYLDWIGERWWVLPNPMYGGWEPAQFNNDWQQSRERRRQAKRDALIVDGTP